MADTSEYGLSEEGKAITSRADYKVGTQVWLKIAADAVIAICKTMEVGAYISVNTYRTDVIQKAGYPLHHNHWGSLVRHLVSLGWIEMTSDVVQATHAAAHGHKVRCYLVKHGKGI